MAENYKALFKKRQKRNRYALKKASSKQVRLSVFRSLYHIYGQLIDDQSGKTLASASTLDAGLRKKLKSGGNIEAAGKVGEILGENAKKIGVTKVVFDRGGYCYHGRVKALAEGARKSGLQF
ncbi:MAG: 50S ribosomal protein L18, partial [Pseudomonadota bacterium]